MAVVAAWIISTARKSLSSTSTHTNSRRCHNIACICNFVVGRPLSQYSCDRNRALFASIPTTTTTRTKAATHRNLQVLLPRKSDQYNNNRSNIVWFDLSRSYTSIHEPTFPSFTAAELELRVGEFERQVVQLQQQQQQQQLSKNELHNRAWHLLSECASTLAHTSLLNYNADNGNTYTGARIERRRRSEKSPTTQRELLLRAQLGTRILHVCAKEVESRRLFLWSWLEEDFDTNNNNNNNSDDTRTTTTSTTTDRRFSPTAYWNEAPHPTKDMYSRVFSLWKGVIESCSAFSIQSTDAMDLMERCARQSSSLLSRMEEEHSADAAFVDAYNARIPTGRYALLRAGAVLPDVRNYSEVIGTWGQCIDGSNNLRQSSSSSSSEKHGRSSSGRQNYYSSARDGAYHKRLKLEATAMKSMMELLESMEEDLYGTFGSDAITKSGSRRKRPPPDRYCYNVLLAAMARQINPSLYEMRLVLQRMMERVKYELELLDNDPDLEEGSESAAQLYELAMSFFPDVYSYNALIEARANRSAMFASDSQLPPQPTTIQGYATALRLWNKSAWMQREDNAENLSRRKKRFTASEEEAILAEQILEEMCHLATVTVRPNIWSYNAVIKSWIRTDSERGLQRAVLIANALAMNGHDRMRNDGKSNEAERSDTGTTVFGRIASWGASLLGSGNSNDREDIAFHERSRIKPYSGHDSRSNIQSESPANLPSHETKCRNSNQTSQGRVQSVGMASRLSYLYSAGEEVKGNATRAHQEVVSPESKQESFPSSPTLSEVNDMPWNLAEPIGPLPHIEVNVTPDLKTFLLVSQALERRGTALSAKLAEDLLRLLEEYYPDLNSDIAIYNSVLNAFAKAAKDTSDARACFESAQKADDLLCILLQNDRIESDTTPRPNEYSFLLAINAWSNAAATAVSTGKNISGGRSAALNAEVLLQKLQLQPLKISKSTIACYGSVIRTWASLGDAEQAQRVLEYMVEVSDCLPLDIIHFNAVFDVWARNLAHETDQDRALWRLLKIRDLLMRMKSGSGYESYNVDPDTSSFNQVIRACYSPWGSAQSQEGESIRCKAFDIAYECYTKMIRDYDSSHRPDAHTYAHMFKAISCLLPSYTTESQSKKYDVCQEIFHACCRDGHLTKSSIWTLRKCLPNEDEFASLILSEMGKHEDLTKEKLLLIPEDRVIAYLPKEWSRHGRNLKALNRHRQ